MEKNYTDIPFTEAQVRAMKVGTEFVDGGTRMRVTAVSAAYINRRGKPAFDVKAVKAGPARVLKMVPKSERGE